MKELDTPVGREVKAVYDAGELVQDDLIIRMIRDRLDRGDTHPGLRPRRLSAQHGAGGGARRAAGRARPRRSTSCSSSRWPTRRAARADARSAPPRRAAPTTRPRRSGSGSRSTSGRRRRSSSTTARPAATSSASTPTGRSTRSSPRSGRRSTRWRPRVIIRKSPDELERMARAGRIVADTLALIGEHARPGRHDRRARRARRGVHRRQGGYPTFKGYRGYPAATCISPNAMIVHGIPGPYELADGDILSVDVGVTLDGFVADSAYTFAIGEISAEAERLLEVGQAALSGRDRAVPGRQPALGHLARRPAGDRERRVLGRAQPRRPRRRALDARGSADPELRRAGARAGARRRDDVRDRADDQRGRAGHRRARRRVVDLDAPTARCRPISSTPWRSRRPGRGS